MTFVRLQHSVMCVQGRVSVTALRLCVLLSGGPRRGHYVLVPSQRRRGGQTGHGRHFHRIKGNDSNFTKCT